MKDLKLNIYTGLEGLLMRMTTTYHQALASEENEVTSESIGLQSYESYKNGYKYMHQALDRYYTHLLDPEEEIIFQNSKLWKTGYILDSILDHHDILKRWDDYIQLHGNKRSLANEIIANTELYDGFCSDWHSIVNSEKFTKQIGSKLLIFNLFTDVLVPSEDRLSVSGKWHYDNYTPGSYVRIMFFLNDYEEHSGGIDIFDQSWSRIFSDTTGYVGIPVSKRIDNLEELCSHDKSSYSPTQVRPASGDFLCFSPSRCLHRGINPTKGPRRVVFLCGIPISPEVPNTQLLEYSKQLIRCNVSGDQIPIFRKLHHGKQDDPIRLDQPQLSHSHLSEQICRMISVGSDTIYARLIRLFSDRINPSETQLELLEEVLLDLKLAADEAEEFVPILRRYIQYISSINSELSRYRPNNLVKRSHIFWPDPTHHRYPATLLEQQPFAQSSPIINRSTPISTAGSCFAYEIARKLQQRGYNYVVAERPARANGIIVSDFNESDPYVPFSANYGILFNTLSLHQLAQRAFREKQFQKLLCIHPGSDYLVDPYREMVYFVNADAYRLDYNRHTLALQSMLLQSRVFVFTLGLNECWCLRSDDSAISRNPPPDIIPYVYHRRLSLEDNLKALSGFFELVKKYNPEFKMILTVSPIPFLATGNADKQHVIEANTHSKAMLRIAAQEIADRYEDAYYFPSYEHVSFCELNPWEADLRHVRGEVVERVVSLFEAMFMAS